MQGTTPVVTSFNPEALDKIAAAEASRFSKDGKDEAYAKELTNQLVVQSYQIPAASVALKG